MLDGLSFDPFSLLSEGLAQPLDLAHGQGMNGRHTRAYGLCCDVIGQFAAM